MSDTIIVEVDETHLVLEPELTEVVILQAGVPGVSGQAWVSGVPVEATGGGRTVFTTPIPYVGNGILVFLNGLRETHFSATSNMTITFETAPIAGDEISLFYRTS